MKINKIFLVSMFVLAIIMLGAVSAAEEAGNLTVSDNAGEAIEAPVDEIEVAADISGGDELADDNEAPINISIPDDVVLDDYFSVKVTVPENATGYVSLYIDDYYQSSEYDEDGRYDYCCCFDEFGEHMFRAQYTAGEDDIYSDAVKEVSYYLNNTQYRISLYDDVAYGDNLIYFSAPSAVRSNTVITVNGKRYDPTIIEDEDGDYRGAFNVSGLKYGDNEVTIYNPGDEDFGEFNQVQVIHANAKIVADESVNIGQVANVTLILPANGTGNLRVYSREVDYDIDYNEIITDTQIGSADAVNGKAVVGLTGLPVGYNSIFANFTGNYEVDDYDGYITVHPKITSPKAIVAGEESYVTVEVSEGSTGSLSVDYWDSTSEEKINVGTADVENNIAKVSLADLAVGTYDLKISYSVSGDGWEFYKELYVVESLDFNVSIIDYPDEITVNSEDAYYVHYDLPMYADGDVALKVDGKTVDTRVADFYDNSCVFYPENLTMGEHTLTVDFISSTQKNSTDSVKFNIVLAMIDIPDKITENDVDENLDPYRIFIGYPTGSSGSYVISIDNEKFKTVKFDDSYNSHYTSLPDAPRGTHNVTITVNDDKYGSVSKSNTVIFDYVFGISAGCYYGQDNEIIITPPTYLGDGDLIITLDGEVQDWSFNQDYNEIRFTASNMSLDNHVVLVKYTGDELYPAKEQNFTVKVWTGFIYSSDIVEGTDEGITLLLPGDAKGNVNLTVLIGDYNEFDDLYFKPFIQKTVPLVNGKAYYSFKDLKVNEYKVSASYGGNDYEVDDADFYLSVLEEEGIQWGENSLVLGENKTVSFTSRDNDTSVLKLTLCRILDPYYYEDIEDKTVVVETHEIPIINGKASYTFDNLTLGRYHLRAIQEYENAPGYQGGHDFGVYPTKTEVKIGAVFDDNNRVFIELPDDATGKAILTIRSNNYFDDTGSIYSIDEYAVNGSILIDLPSHLPEGNYGYLVNYTGNYGNHLEGYWHIYYGNIERFDSKMKVNISDIIVGEDAAIDISLPVLSVGATTVTIGDATYDANATKGKATVTISDLKAGSYDVKVTFNGDRKFFNQTKTVPLTVSKKSAEIEVAADERIVEGSTLTVNVTVANATGKVAVNGKDADLINGKASIDVNDLALGNNTLFVFYGGDEIYENASTTIMVNVYPKQDAQLAADVLDINVGETAVVNVQINPNATGKLTVNGTEVVPQNGKVSVPFADLVAGEYPIAINFEGDKYVKPANVTISFKVNKVQPKTGDDPFNPAENETKSGNLTYTISMPSDATGNLTVTIANKTYTKELVNGTATIEITDLPAGTYEAVVTYTGDDKYEAVTKTENATVKVTPKITAKSTTTVLYTAKGKFTVTVYGDDGKVAKGVDVVFIIKGKQIKKTTNSNGIAKYTVTRVPGTYKVTVKALGVNTTKTLKVKHVVTLKKATVKRSAKKLTLTATLSKVNGKYLKNKNVTFKFKGKKYTAKTNAKGVAKVTIKSAVLKKLKAGKKVTYSATYKKDTVKKTVKVKK